MVWPAGGDHDDVNLICMGAWIIGIAVAKEVLDAFVNATFSTDPDFRRRVDKLAEMERKYAAEIVRSG